MAEHSFTLPSYAKINLCLEIRGKRPDGYHEIDTVFQTVSLRDDISFRAGRDLILTCDDPHVPLGGDNLIIKAAESLRSRYGMVLGASIHLQKRIPSPGGLGGGSSNAAVALLGLKRLWGIEVGFDEMNAIAGELGSDVPFFLYGGTARGTGRGTEITPLVDFDARFILIVTPGIAVSTRAAFEGVHVSNLTTGAANRNLSVCRFDANGTDFYPSMLRNDFESTVLVKFPEIRNIRQMLVDYGAAALLSGSGASVFGIFDKEETRQTAIKALGDQTNWRSFAVATISRDQYREAVMQ